MASNNRFVNGPAILYILISQMIFCLLKIHPRTRQASLKPTHKIFDAQFRLVGSVFNHPSSPYFLWNLFESASVCPYDSRKSWHAKFNISFYSNFLQINSHS
ncbi:hypothetical protein KFK09_013219 [Dendrobium nobile]|uniref:Uncharacterized protein n=1 Tax=Dendrobium nobile TaxID=94219 RepID=A0A8T3B8A1_DENNO|nr:hypothetical protein KFK09_013219 [Dendrobium nobile]